jgi:transposase-like protein
VNPHPLFCPNLACPSRGIQNAGNIRVHDSLRNRWRCTTCKKTFSGRQATPFYHLKTAEATIVLVLSLLAWGCPLQAIVAAFGFDERTVASWQERAGKHCQKVHADLVTAHPMDLQQVQADEMRVKMQKRLVVWMAMAICVPSRLWLGGVLSASRDKHLLRALAAQVRACARFGPLLLVTDGLKSYVDAWHKAFRTPIYTGKRGHPRLLAWPTVVIGQMVKRYERGRVIGIEQRWVQGTKHTLGSLLSESFTLSTAYIERLNATFRARLCCLVRRGRALGRKPQRLTCAMYLLGCVYNFCTPHQSLSQEGACTPAMAAGLSGHVWSVGELLFYRIAPPPFVPKKRRGRKPKTRATGTEGGNRLVTV